MIFYRNQVAGYSSNFDLKKKEKYGRFLILLYFCTQRLGGVWASVRVDDKRLKCDFLRPFVLTLVILQRITRTARFRRVNLWQFPFAASVVRMNNWIVQVDWKWKHSLVGADCNWLKIYARKGFGKSQNLEWNAWVKMPRMKAKTANNFDETEWRAKFNLNCRRLE